MNDAKRSGYGLSSFYAGEESADVVTMGSLWGIGDLERLVGTKRAKLQSRVTRQEGELERTVAEVLITDGIAASCDGGRKGT